MSKRKVLVCIGYYLPGFKSGGPVRSMANMVAHLVDDVQFYIVTSDRDLGDDSPYPEVVNDGEWVDVANARVLYLKKGLSFSGFKKVVEQVRPDYFYLNSFFDFRFSIRILCYLRLMRVGASKIIVAPRGEFADAALDLKAVKKNIYILLSKIVGLYRNVNFHASTQFEKNDILSNFSCAANVLIAMDLPAVSPQVVAAAPCEDRATIKIVFLSRISPMKNLEFALSILYKIERQVTFDIYGPVEDQLYWSSCLELISVLPSNIQVKYQGLVHQNDVLNVLSKYDLLFLPSRGENFCHVIAESLSVGTPVLTSDRTPWRDLTAKGLGWDLSLDAFDEYANVIKGFQIPGAEYRLLKKMEVIRSYHDLNLVMTAVDDSKRLFECIDNMESVK